jgi:predicted metal-binding membrane protein
MTSDARRALLPASLLAMSATAWVVVSRLGDVPAQGHTHGLHEGGAAFGSGIAATFIGGWVLMTVAMMLPTTLPLLQVFRRLTAARRDGMVLTLLVIGGYLAAWTAFGAVVFAANAGLQAALDGNAWLAAHPRTPTAALFLVAGTFQFSELKYRCLDKCRSPLGFITSRWRGGHERWRSFRIGVEHGAFCVGCCWALMLLMFVSAATSLAWMLVLAAVMAVEKNVSWGRRASRPVGVVLLAAASILLIAG